LNVRIDPGGAGGAPASTAGFTTCGESATGRERVQGLNPGRRLPIFEGQELQSLSLT
jgi:hypothetical protein